MIISFRNKHTPPTVKPGSVYDFDNYLPVGNAVSKLTAWKKQGAEIVYLTSRRIKAEIESIRKILAKYHFPNIASTYPVLGKLNIMRLATPQSPILSAVIFNALIIPLLIPLALRGVQFRPMPAGRLFIYNLVIFGIGGIIAPFLGIKAIDLILSAVTAL